MEEEIRKDVADRIDNPSSENRRSDLLALHIKRHPEENQNYNNLKLSSTEEGLPLFWVNMVVTPLVTHELTSFSTA
jgi:hypothetical protein